MDKRKIIISTIISVGVIFIVSMACYFLFIKQDEDTTLTLMDKQWIENNKNTIIDLGIVNDVPVFSHGGSGVIFDFIDSLEATTDLEFNKLSYKVGEDVPTDYSFMLVDKVKKNDIVFYEDNYSIFTKNNTKYNSLEDIPSMVIGVLSSDLDDVNYYLKANKGLQYKSYENVSDIVVDMNDGKIDAFALPQIVYFNVLANETFYSVYNITEMGDSLVLRLGNTSKLNNIINKYSSKWIKSSLNLSYSTHFSEMYFLFNDVSEQEITSFKSKSYVYGFVNNAPYDQSVNNKLVGINKELIKEFAKTANVDVKYKQYDNIDDLNKAFNSNKVDFMLSVGSNNKFDIDVVESVSLYEEELAIVSSNLNNLTINSLASLKNVKVSVVKGTKIEKLLKSYDIDVKTYSSLMSLLNNVDDKSVIAIDLVSYNVYSNSLLDGYRVNYSTSVDYDYGYIARDIKANKLFNSYLNFYLGFINEKEVGNKVTYDMFEVNDSMNIAIYIILAGIVILIVMFIILMVTKNNGSKTKKVNISKENKLRYIDMLTSLKNRTYLNDSMPKWDDSEIYPQSIIIVDLNNIAYINDNYGHEEGDKVIAQAANILIRMQVENSEIIRTSGNEFLIYMVEYEEKQVVAYIRRLSKEFKELAHGFGAAIGYSMIHDAIKTIDDAINEATLDMRSNKEEANN